MPFCLKALCAEFLTPASPHPVKRVEVGCMLLAFWGKELSGRVCRTAGAAPGQVWTRPGIVHVCMQRYS